ncbi:cellulose synthase [Nocardioides acrostichi]|uniref:Cellulose synthase n=1 Tax=Nocardioides acrostichi TaxID=2784339 RepID=A0A930Y8F6_9ACTN|nr:cellulose synthase [Nocardioides acrostichi]MBF4163057.1 cellulose synthase [Nocardioides acrostichi]
MDDAAWSALALTLTLLGGAGTWWLWRRRGAVAGLRAAAITLLVPAAWATRTLRMFTRIADAVGDWATGLVFSPRVWTGVALAGVSLVLLVLARLLAARRPAVTAAPTRGQPAVSGRHDPDDRDELGDIEDLLRQRGIS